MKSYKRHHKQPKQQTWQNSDASSQFTLSDLIEHIAANNDFLTNLRKEATKQHKQLGKLKNR